MVDEGRGDVDRRLTKACAHPTPNRSPRTHLRRVTVRLFRAPHSVNKVSRYHHAGSRYPHQNGDGAKPTVNQTVVPAPGSL
jgi:hypothetical protein